MNTIQNIKVVSFDADDTLWINEPYFRETEDRFCGLLGEYGDKQRVSDELLRTETQNISIYGYGIKSFILSMIETSLRLSDGKIPTSVIGEIVECGKNQLHRPVHLLEGAEQVLQALKGKYRLVVATKGDLLDQQRKLEKSGLEPYFHHIEVMSDKKTADYEKLIRHLDCSPDEFLMIGNSLKSDILPVLEAGGYGAYIPYHITWSHERVDEPIRHARFIELRQLTDILPRLDLHAAEIPQH